MKMKMKMTKKSCPKLTNANKRAEENEDNFIIDLINLEVFQEIAHINDPSQQQFRKKRRQMQI